MLPLINLSPAVFQNMANHRLHGIIQEQRAGGLRLLRQLDEQVRHLIGISRLAAMENYNTSYYTSWFRKKFGCTPSDYLKMIRIEKAKEILATTRYRIIDVAMQVGYTNCSSFTRAFHEVVGTTPSHYRQADLKPRDEISRQQRREETSQRRRIADEN